MTVTQPYPPLMAVQVLHTLARRLLADHDVSLYYGRADFSPSLTVRRRDVDRAMVIVADIQGYYRRDNSRWIGELQSPIATATAIRSMLAIP